MILNLKNVVYECILSCHIPFRGHNFHGESIHYWTSVVFLHNVNYLKKKLLLDLSEEKD